MELQIALSMVTAAMEDGRRLGAAPLAVVVLDAGGNVVAAAREDGCGIARLQMAHGKAWGSLGLGFGSRTLSQRVEMNPSFFAAAASLLDGRLLPAPGGALVMRDGILLGSVGVSGDAADIDEACALHAIDSVALTAVT